MQDKAKHSMTSLAKPAVGQAVTDPAFGTTIRRITNAGSGGIMKPAYSTIPAWNADESYLILYHTGSSNAGHHLYNGRTYQHIKELDIAPADLEHFYWSSTDPDILFYPFAYEASGTPVRQLIKYHVSTGQKEVAYNIPNGGWRTDFGGDPVYGSYDNDLFGLRQRADSDSSFTFRLSTKTESPRLAGDVPQISPSGRYYLDLARNSVVNAATNATIRTRTVETDSHGSMVRLANGQDVWATVQFDNYEGTLVTENLDTGVVKVIIGPQTGYPYPPTGTHLSGHAFGAPGWVAISATGNPAGQNLLDQELLLANLNTNTFCRVGHHRSHGADGNIGYWAEPHVNISPSGTRLLFGSDWGGGNSVDSYVVELPSYRP